MACDRVICDVKQDGEEDDVIDDSVENDRRWSIIRNRSDDAPPHRTSTYVGTFRGRRNQKGDRE
jgi:hypothetical protein